ncbi:MAG: hypothetical protein J3K34DRAFT_404355 [Monoraphidium minutum]|nr:MAG: hypothetical protein J3K34DRAFT_404355 [Monoraphidium minutum]
MHRRGAPRDHHGSPHAPSLRGASRPRRALRPPLHGVSPAVLRRDPLLNPPPTVKTAASEHRQSIAARPRPFPAAIAAYGKHARAGARPPSARPRRPPPIGGRAPPRGPGAFAAAPSGALLLPAISLAISGGRPGALLLFAISLAMSRGPAPWCAAIRHSLALSGARALATRVAAPVRPSTRGPLGRCTAAAAAAACNPVQYWTHRHYSMLLRAL